MGILRVVLAIVLMFMLSASSRAADAAPGIVGLGYAMQADHSLYFTGQYQGKPVHIVRKRLAGVGTWVIYSGTVSDRVRLTLDDKQGLVDVLAMDSGQRMTVRRIGKERIEYRLYGADRQFIIGAVLYRKERAWLLGLMQSEAFPGYGALKAVSDVSRSVAQQSLPVPLSLAAWVGQHWQQLALLPLAHAQENDADLIGRLARDRWGVPGNEMWKGALVGAAAFTVKLLGTGDTLVLAGTVAVAAPFLTTVAVGVGVGLAADKVRDWAGSRNLGNAGADFYRRLVADTPFSTAPAPEPPAPMPPAAASGRPTPALPRSASAASAASSTVNGEDLVSMADQLDQLDQQDFQGAIEIAQACIRRHDFACADEQLASAKRRANSVADAQQMAATRQAARDEQQRIADAARARAEEERRLALVEERRRADLRRQEQERARVAAAAEESGASGMQWGKAAALFGGAMIGGLNKLSVDAQGKIISGILKDSAAGQDGISNLNAATATAPAAGAGRAAQRAMVASAAPAGPLSQRDQRWHDAYSNKVTATGEVKHYPSHETDIPGDVVASRAGSQAAAGTVWANQDGRVTSYQGCGACGVGSTITIVVDFGYIVDTHVYTRDK
jgi:hypothetical protein